MPTRDPRLSWRSIGWAMSVACVLTLCSTTQAQIRTIYSFDAPFGDGLNEVLDTNDGLFYATTRGGGAFAMGAVVRFTLFGTVDVLHSFRGTDGSVPLSGLTVGRDGSLYGTTSQGGANGFGTAFRVTRTGRHTTLHSFSLAEGGAARAPLALASDGSFYGVTAGLDESVMGVFSVVSWGAVFRMTHAGVVTLVHEFDGSDGGRPFVGLIEGADGALYGTTSLVQSDIEPRRPVLSWGTLFRVEFDGLFETLHTFNGLDGGNPRGRLLQTSDGALYGTSGLVSEAPFGPASYGTVFTLDAGGTFSTLYDFGGTDSAGVDPAHGLVQGDDGNLYGTTQGVLGADDGGSLFRVTPSGNLTVVHAFTLEEGRPSWPLSDGGRGYFYGSGGTTFFRITESGSVDILSRVGFRQGRIPIEEVAMARDLQFYGCVSGGGRYGFGGVYRLTRWGTVSLVVSFPESSASGPLVLGPDGALYGILGGTGTVGESGSIFRVTTSGELSTVYQFTHTTLEEPRGPRGHLTPDGAGGFYGVTVSGGASLGGTIFHLSSSGDLTVLFEGGGIASSVSTPLLLASDGNLYGTSRGGGDERVGTVFRLPPEGTLEVIHSFSRSGGFGPDTGLIEARDGMFYGMTAAGGGPLSNGTIFRITSAGDLTSLYSFGDEPDGHSPSRALMQGLDGNFYGTTFFGGAESAGIAFRITPAGAYTVLDSFPATGAIDSPTAGASSLEQFGIFTLIGATRRGGTSNQGSLYLLR